MEANVSAWAVSSHKKDVQTGRINLDSHLWKETDNTSRIVFYFFSAARRKDVLIPA